MADHSDEDYDDELLDDWEAAADEVTTQEAQERKRQEQKVKKRDIVEDDAGTSAAYVNTEEHLTQEAQRAKQRAAERAADAANAAALLGGTNQSFAMMQPKSPQEFSDYAHRMALLLQTHQESRHYARFVEALTKHVAKSLKKEQLSELDRVVKVAHEDSARAKKAESKRSEAKKATTKPSAKTTGFDMDVSDRGGGVAADAEENFM